MRTSTGTKVESTLRRDSSVSFTSLSVLIAFHSCRRSDTREGESDSLASGEFGVNLGGGIAGISRTFPLLSVDVVLGSDG